MIGLLALFANGYFRNRKTKGAQLPENFLKQMRELVLGLDIAIGEIERAAKHAAEDLNEHTQTLSKQMIEQWSQVRAAAINATIEASKDPEILKKFKGYFDEISKNTTQGRNLCDDFRKLGKSSEPLMAKIKDLDDLLARVTDDAVVFSPRDPASKIRGK